MQKTVVVYKSKYGSTKTYAEWLAQALGCDLFATSEIGIDKLAGYDTIIFGGGMYAGGILGLSLITKNYERLSGKRIALFCVGASLQAEKAAQEVRNRHLTGDMKDKIAVFFLRGGLNYKKMNLLDRFLMFMLKSMIKRNQNSDNDSMGILATYGKTVDFTNKKAIEPILKWAGEGE